MASRRDRLSDRAGRRITTPRMLRAEAQAKEYAEGPRKAYWVTQRGTIRYDGDDYGPGDKIEVDKRTAEALLASRSIAKTKAAAVGKSDLVLEPVDNELDALTE